MQKDQIKRFSTNVWIIYWNEESGSDISQKTKAAAHGQIVSLILNVLSN